MSRPVAGAAAPSRGFVARTRRAHVVRKAVSSAPNESSSAGASDDLRENRGVEWVTSQSAHAAGRKRPGPDMSARLNLEAKRERCESLARQAKLDLTRTCALYERPVFTNALIAGDCVILDIIAKAGLLEDVPIVFLDTLHLFDETLEFLEHVEAHYGFQARRYLPAGCDSREDWNRIYSSDLYISDMPRYDELAKVEPLQRALRETHADAWINGRRRDHGHDRAALEVYEAGAPAGPEHDAKPAKINVIAHWTFRDVWDYIELNGIPYHPLHDEGYPSLGDVQTTLPVERAKWFEYAGERSGRWSGDAKTECGIHSPIGGASSPLPGPSSKI